MHRILTLLLALLCQALAAAPSVEQLFAPPQVRDVRLSPDGRHLALSWLAGPRRAIALVDLQTRQLRVLAQAPERDLIQPLWLSPSRLAYRSWDFQVTGPQNRAGGVYAIDIDGERARQLWPELAQSEHKPWVPMHFLGAGPKGELLVSQTDRAPSPGADRFPGSDVYAVDSLSGRRRLLTLDNPGQVQQWVLDAQGQPRAAYALRPGPAGQPAVHQIWWRAQAEGDWQLLGEHGLDAEAWQPAAFDAEGQLLVLARAGHDTLGLYRWDTERRALGEPLLRHPRADLSPTDLVFDGPGRLVGADAHALQREPLYLDPAWTQAQAAVDRALPGRRNQLQRRGDALLVYSQADNELGRWFWRASPQAALTPLLRAWPELKSAELGRKLAFHYRARDGLQIPAYLTLPPGLGPDERPPLVLMPHGGPFERDSWASYADENEPLQLLATRGYAVLQPQFRGSWGLGWALHRAGWKQWAEGQVNDLLDGLQHLVQAGRVDGTRVCTLGKSAGGYLALAALQRAEANTFRCGISWAGSAEMALFFSEPSAIYAGSAWLRHIDPGPMWRPTKTPTWRTPRCHATPRASRPRCCWPMARPISPCPWCMASNCATR